MYLKASFLLGFSATMVWNSLPQLISPKLEGTHTHYSLLRAGDPLQKCALLQGNVTDHRSKRDVKIGWGYGSNTPVGTFQIFKGPLPAPCIVCTSHKSGFLLITGWEFWETRDKLVAGTGTCDRETHEWEYDHNLGAKGTYQCDAKTPDEFLKQRREKYKMCDT
mmetsp:Transcript_14683/g.23899  ORF Transcript_14683/g.23899 Transcript_14683/m.23899 type:complete len:164 (+) Transcript_14683:192-683(+)